MPGEKPPLKSVREHAESVVAQMQAELAEKHGRATDAVGLPAFSAGTAVIDPETHEAVPVAPAQPEFSQGAPVTTDPAAPAQGSKPGEGAEPAPRSKEAILKAHAERLAEAGVAPEPEAAPQGTQAAAASGAAAAEQAAADAFAEYEEFEFEDPDLETKIPVRVPKQYAQTAKRGYGRRAAYDRAIRYAKEANPTLAALIEDGRINGILPLLQRALEDTEYGEYVAEGYQRRLKGESLKAAALQEAAAAGAAPVAPVPAQQGLYDFRVTDPLFEEQIAPVRAQLETINQQLARQQAEQQAAMQRQQAERQRQEQFARELQSAHHDLATMLPDVFTGDLNRDGATWKRTLDYARDSGYVNAYGTRAGVIFAGQKIAELEAERRSFSASPSATLLAAQEQKLTDLARTEAANASRLVAAGTPTQAPPKPRPQPPNPRLPDGRMKPSGDYLREQQAYLAATRA